VHVQGVAFYSRQASTIELVQYSFSTSTVYRLQAFFLNSIEFRFTHRNIEAQFEQEIRKPEQITHAPLHLLHHQHKLCQDSSCIQNPPETQKNHRHRLRHDQHGVYVTHTQLYAAILRLQLAVQNSVEWRYYQTSWETAVLRRA
jgi:hypothetical protein